MKTLKQRVFYGVLCDQIIYNVADGTEVRTARPSRPRFKTEAEREQHKTEISRRKHTRAFNENFDPSSLYSTLTFDMENEVHTAAECKQLRELYVRRLKYACPDAVIFAYYGQGKTTHRFHIHIVTSGIPEETIRKKWTFGEVCRIEPLREHCRYDGVDHGPDYTGLANYLFNHWKPEYGGHRWKQTNNARKPEAETPTVARRTYSEHKPPKAPKGYFLVDVHTTRYGYLCFRYCRQPAPKNESRRS